MVTKGKGWGRVNEEVQGRGMKGIMIGTHGVCVDHGKDSVAQRRQVVTLWHRTTLKDSDCSRMWGRLDDMGECSNHSVFHVKLS